ncbi:MAG: Metallo-dependent hydrolase [Candidatus Aminicenantes bacterium]|nr:Metallo-dependent hydrolase [Candidatus Aminicenantes bacterium]
MIKGKGMLGVGVFLLGLALSALGQQTILIRNGRIVPVVGPVIEKGSLLIEKGKIVRIAGDIAAPADAVVIEAEGKSVYPGLIAPMTAIGLTGYPGAGDDLDEVGISVPQMDPFDALNPEDECIEVARLEGVTTVLTIAGTQNVISGQSILVHLDGDLAGDMLIKKNVAQIFNLAARQQGKYPVTLPGVMALIRDKLNQTRRYIEARKLMEKKAGAKPEEAKVEGMGEESFKPSPELEALVPVVQGEVLVVFVTNNEVTIGNALALIKEFNLKGILYATADVLAYADQIKERQIPLIWAGTTNVPRRWEASDHNFRAGSILARNGILFAFDQLGWGPGNRNVRNLPVPAAHSVAHGLAEEEAIRAMTINPAKIFGVEKELGSLEVGKTADLALWSGSPLQMRSRVEKVIIQGRIIPPESVQTRLRDKFEKIVRERRSKPGN